MPAPLEHSDWPDVSRLVERRLASMRFDPRPLWNGTAAAIRVVGPDTMVASAEDAMSVAAALAPVVGAAWDGPAAARLTCSGPARVGDADAYGARSFANRTGANVARAVRLGHAIVHRDAAALAPREVDALSRLMEVDGELAGRVRASLAAMRRPVPEAAPPVDGRVPFLFTWTDAPGQAPVSASVGHAMMPALRASMVPAVARLDAADGRPIHVRKGGDAWFRPVLAPGTWQPVGVGEFMDAAANGYAWADNPFEPPAGRDVVKVAVGDYAVRRDGASTACDAALGEALDRAGQVVVIDGVVHRLTGEPRLHVRREWRGLARDGAAHVDVSLAWHLPDGLHMHAHQGTLHAPPLHPDDGTYLSPGHGWTFGLGEAGRVEAMLDGWLGGGVTRPMARLARHVPGVPFGILDHEAFPDPGDTALRALVSWERGFAPGGGTRAADAARQALDGADPGDVDGTPPQRRGWDETLVDAGRLLSVLAADANEALSARRTVGTGASPGR